MQEQAETFSDRYHLLTKSSSCIAVLRERNNHQSETETDLQTTWHSGLLSQGQLKTDDGRSLRVLSVGWRNQGEGPDFKNAQIELNGKIVTGDIEIHRKHRDWYTHGHHRDPRYDNVILIVVTEDQPPKNRILTSKGKSIPSLLLDNFTNFSKRQMIYSQEKKSLPGSCACRTYNATFPERFTRFLDIAGDWRVIIKADRFQHDVEKRGIDQTLYEWVMRACGFSRYRHEFQKIASCFPYDRARQLAREDPLLLETALLQVAGLLPGFSESESGCQFLKDLQRRKNESLKDLKSLTLTWQKSAVRPTNYPERRLHGVSFFISRTAEEGICRSIQRIWLQDLSPKKRRECFARLFPPPIGFWATHCSWSSREMKRPAAPIGKNRILSIIGNVFVPMALADARKRKDRAHEERVFAFYCKLPRESSNSVYRAMICRFWKEDERPRLNFRKQQGLLQIYRDWCERNPSCHNCSIGLFLNDIVP